MITPERMKPLITDSIFSQLYSLKLQLIDQGMDVTDLSVGSPDMLPATHITDALIARCSDSVNYRYAISDMSQMREAVARWYRRRFDVSLDPQSEITSLLGSQEGLAHLCIALADAHDIVMVQNPGYPIYHSGPQAAQCTLYHMPTDSDNLIDFDSIPTDMADSAKLMIVSYPNNPTAAVADEAFYIRLVAYAKAHNILVIHDNAYCELTFDGYVAGSFLSIDGARDIGIELNSLSKTYNIAGLRIGFALGNSEMIRHIATLKSHMDYGMFVPIQYASIAALDGPQDSIASTRDTYQARRDALIDGLAQLGWHVARPSATMFVWAQLPPRYTSSFVFATDLAKKTGVIVTPGSAFGDRGEGYVRIALVQSTETLLRAIRNIDNSKILA